MKKILVAFALIFITCNVLLVVFGIINYSNGHSPEWTNYFISLSTGILWAVNYILLKCLKK